MKDKILKKIMEMEKSPMIDVNSVWKDFYPDNLGPYESKEREKITDDIVKEAPVKGEKPEDFLGKKEFLKEDLYK